MLPQSRNVRNHSQARPLVILFAHGLESGPNGQKVQQLKKKRTGEREIVVVAPDMQPLIRTARQRILWRVLFPAVVVAVYSGVMLYKDYETEKIPMVLLLTLSLVAFSRHCVMICRNCLQECVHLQLKQFLAHKPDLIMGSSFGGAVIARLISVVNPSSLGPTLLLAPAQFRFDWFTWLGARAFTSYPPETTVLVVHGNQDAVVPLADSERLVKMISKFSRAAELLVVNDQHPLRYTYKDQHREWIQRAIDQTT